jgi:hypothetical protein
VALYNGTTLAHYTLGATGVIIGYDRRPVLGWTIGPVYLAFALVQMYGLMPLTVCPSCAYRRMDGARCISAMNLVSARLAAPRDKETFSRRGTGFLCHNNLYLAALILPLLLMLPALVFAFSWALLSVFLVVVGLLAFRMLILFPRVACGHCAAKKQCPNARAMGIG